MARHHLTRLAALAALLMLAAPARAVSKDTRPPWSLEDLGTGVGAPANCSFEDASSLGASWLEITNIMNFTQYSSLPGADLSTFPDPVPMPYTLSASDNKAPGWLSVCFAQSPTAPAGCEGDACNVYIEQWEIQWLEFALLNCYGSYPEGGLVNFFTSPNPPAGQIGVTVTETCKNYLYTPESGWDFFYSVTDPFGNKWALQTVPENQTTEAEYDAWLAEVEFPAGFSIEKVQLPADGMIHEPFMAGNGCYSIVMKDNKFNSYHLYEYPEGGVNKSNSILGNMGKNCTVLDAKYTLEGMGPAAAPAPSTPAAPEGTATPAPTAGAAAASAPALLLAAAIAALMLF